LATVAAVAMGWSAVASAEVYWDRVDAQYGYAISWAHEDCAPYLPDSSAYQACFLMQKSFYAGNAWQQYYELVNYGDPYGMADSFATLAIRLSS
jgi:hypothetical protein